MQTVGEVYGTASRGEEFVGDKKSVKTTKTGKIQDAHEAIRPTDSSLSPAMIKEQHCKRSIPSLSADLDKICGKQNGRSGIRDDIC